EDLVAREIVHDLGAVLRNHEHVFQSRAADSRLTFAGLHRDRHAFFENLRMIERPQAIDDRHVVSGARAETDTVADLAGEDLDFTLVSPFCRRRKVLRSIGRCLAWFDFADDGIEALAHLLIPVLFFGCRFAADDEGSIGAASVPHITCAPIRAVDWIADPQDRARGVTAAVEGPGPGTPTARNGGFQAHLIAGRRS